MHTFPGDRGLGGRRPGEALAGIKAVMRPFFSLVGHSRCANTMGLAWGAEQTLGCKFQFSIHFDMGSCSRKVFNGSILDSVRGTDNFITMSRFHYELAVSQESPRPGLRTLLSIRLLQSM